MIKYGVAKLPEPWPSIFGYILLIAALPTLFWLDRETVSAMQHEIRIWDAIPFGLLFGLMFSRKAELMHQWQISSWRRFWLAGIVSGTVSATLQGVFHPTLTIVPATWTFAAVNFAVVLLAIYDSVKKPEAYARMKFPFKIGSAFVATACAALQFDIVISLFSAIGMTAIGYLWFILGMLATGVLVLEIIRKRDSADAAAGFLAHARTLGGRAAPISLHQE